MTVASHKASDNFSGQPDIVTIHSLSGHLPSAVDQWRSFSYDPTSD